MTLKLAKNYGGLALVKYQLAAKSNRHAIPKFNQYAIPEPNLKTYKQTNGRISLLC